MSDGIIKKRPLGGSRQDSPIKKSNNDWASISASMEDRPPEILNARYILLRQVELDPDNPRRLSVTIEDIKSGPILPDSPFDEEAQEAYKRELTSYYSKNKNKSRGVDEHFEIALFAASLKNKSNLLNPITVYNELGRFVVIAGERRTLAHTLLRENEIKAIIAPKPADDLEKLKMQWFENNDRRSLSLADKVENALNIVKKWNEKHLSQMSVRTLISYIGLEKRLAEVCIKIIKNSDDRATELVLNALEEDYITSLELLWTMLSLEFKEAQSAISDLKKGKSLNAKFIRNSKKKPEIMASNVHKPVPANTIEPIASPLNIGKEFLSKIGRTPPTENYNKPMIEVTGQVKQCFLESQTFLNWLAKNNIELCSVNSDIIMKFSKDGVF